MAMMWPLGKLLWCGAGIQVRFVFSFRLEMFSSVITGELILPQTCITSNLIDKKNFLAPYSLHKLIISLFNSHFKNMKIVCVLVVKC